jgi:hypothetical protein
VVLLCLLGLLGLVLTGVSPLLIIQMFQPARPQPAIVSHGCDDDSTRLFEYSVRTWAEVRNDGASGDMVFEATVTEGNKSWTKTKRSKTAAHDTQRFEIVFDEASSRGGEDRCAYRVYGLAAND